MRCTNCGSEISSNQSFCGSCGAPIVRQNSQFNNGGNQFNNQPQKSKGGVPVWLFLIILLLVVAIMLGVMFFILNKDKDEDDDTSSKSSSVANEDDDDDDDDNKKKKNNTTNSSNGTGSNSGSSSNSGSGSSSSSYVPVNTYTVVYDNYMVSIPNDIQYTVKDNKLIIADYDETWGAQIEYAKASYSQYASSKDQLASKLRQSGITVENYGEKTIGGRSCLYYNISDGGINSMVVITSVNSTLTTCIEVINADYTTFDEDAAKEALAVAITGKELSTTTTNLNTDKGGNHIKQILE